MKKVLIGVVLEVWLEFLGGAGREGYFKQKMQGRGDMESKGIGKKVQSRFWKLIRQEDKVNSE